MTRDDRGSGTVLVLALSTVLVMVGMLLAALAAVGVARHRAASAADLAALAAADRALVGERAACAAAARAARAVGADLEACRLTGDIADVVAVVQPPGAIGRLGAARGVARAGPGEADWSRIRRTVTKGNDRGH
jgi:secretion/DNA translocation related TadE-like protein